MSFLFWIIIGGIAGWIASKIMGTDAQQGLILNVVVGIIGGLIGGWVLNLFHLSTGSSTILSLLTAVLGACILLFLVGLVTGSRRP